MISKNYAIFTTGGASFEQMCGSLLYQMKEKDNILKIVFFGLSKSNEEFISHLRILRNCVDASFPGKLLPICYVSQCPLVGALNAEVLHISSVKDLTITYGENYLILENESGRELITGGLLPPDITTTISIQSDAVFSLMEEILVKENFPLNSIVRQWNYIEKITRFDGHHQHYQDFNDSRSRFYSKSDWSHGYPAATGIGTHLGGVMVEFVALSGNETINMALDNPLQISAHRYSQKVLLGETDKSTPKLASPKFERARIIGSPLRQTVYISGTAAIRGEASCLAGDVVEQTRITMENIDHLTSPDNYPFPIGTRTYKLLRVYLKDDSLIEDVSRYLSVNYPEPDKIYICADVCRDELLLEIEGVAEVVTISEGI